MRHNAPPNAPFAIVEKQRGAMRIVALCQAAAAIGLMPGLPLADARARVPGLAVVEADPAGDAALLDRLLTPCRRYSPSVAVDPPQGLLLDIAGCTHVFKEGEAGLRAALLARLAALGLTARGACADTPDAARALARFGSGDVRALPVQALELGEAAHLALRRSGFRRIGDLADLPRAPLAARFGLALPLQLARLLGEEDSHITPAPVVEPIAAALRFAEPIGRAFVLRLERSDGHVARLMVETGAPTRDPALLLRLLRERIDSLADPLDPGFGYDAITLAVPHAEAIDPDQPALLADGKGVEDGALGALLDRLAVRYGPDSVLRFVPGNSHVPERAAYLAAVRAGPDWPMRAEGGDPPLRPVTLLDPPQRVEVLAAVPDGPPRRFRWRGRSHEVVAQEGPERIAPEWWRRPGGHGPHPGLSRDYYRVEDGEGRRFWLFRHGLYGAEAAHPGWYVHGLFA